MSISGGSFNSNKNINTNYDARSAEGAEGGPSDAELSVLMERARGTSEVDVAKDVSALGKTQGATAAEKMAAGLKLPPVLAPDIKLTSEHTKGANTLMNNFSPAMDAAMGSVQASAMGNKTGVQLSELSADALLAEFLKLEITDPNNSVETHNDLHSALSKLKQKGIKDAQVKAERANEMKKEAEQYAKTAKILGAIVSAIVIAASIVLAAVTFGAAGALVVGACVLAGALIGGIAAAADGGDVMDGVMMGASIGAAVGGLAAGPVAAASAAAQAAATTAATAASTAAETAAKATTEAAKKTAEETAKTAAKKAVETAQKAVDEAAKNAAKEGASKASQQALSAAEKALASAETGLTQVTAGQFQAASTTFAEGATFCKEAVTCSMEGARAAYSGAVGVMGAVEGSYQAGSNVTIAQKNADAQSMDLLSKRIRALMEKFQEQIQEEGEIINMIMESKNKSIEARLKMGEAAHSSALKNISTMMSK